MTKPQDVSDADISDKGEFLRTPASYRNFVSSDPNSKFPAESGRYVVYIANACPWCTRVLTVLKAKGLEDSIRVITVGTVFKSTSDQDDHRGWVFDGSDPLVPSQDPITGAKTIREIYESKTPKEMETPTRFTVPLFFDTKTDSIVSNESSEIIVFLNEAFNAVAKNPDLDLYPKELCEKIDEMNEYTYNRVNNGVYRCGFARSQEAYDIASTELFERLDDLEKILETSRYLVSDTKVTLADVRLVQTLVRFDDVYVVHFKCAKKCLREYNNLYNYMLDVVQELNMAGKEGDEDDFGAIHMKHIKHHYFESHGNINPFHIVPKTPNINFFAKHNRQSQ